MRFNEIQEILKNKTVGIAGCGGLGSNCAVALARVGVGKLIIADFDKVEESNLNRQYFFYDQIGMLKATTLKENISRINPNIEVISHDLRLDENNISGLYACCDVIVEAFDNPKMKEIIMKVHSTDFPDKYLIMGIGMAGWGKNNLLSEHKYDTVIICGDQLTEVSDDCPPLAPRVGIVANMQANTVLEVLLGDMF